MTYISCYDGMFYSRSSVSFVLSVAGWMVRVRPYLPISGTGCKGLLWNIVFLFVWEKQKQQDIMCLFRFVVYCFGEDLRTQDHCMSWCVWVFLMCLKILRHNTNIFLFGGC
jgi:hypothetical protein